MTLLLFTGGLARKLQQKGHGSKGTNNDKQGEKSFGEFKGAKPMATWLGASQLQTFRHSSRRLVNSKIRKLCLAARFFCGVLCPPKKLPGSCLPWAVEMHPVTGKGLTMNKTQYL